MLWERIMSERKKGSACFSVRSECRRTNMRYVFFISALLLGLGILTRWICGSPLPIIHMLGIGDILMPTWLFVLLFSASYIVSGAALGTALGERASGRADKKYQGAMWFCIMASLGYVWYPVFFCARLFLIALIISAACVFCAVCATVCFARVSFLSFWSMVLYDVWLVYLLMLNMQIFFMI